MLNKVMRHLSRRRVGMSSGGASTDKVEVIQGGKRRRGHASWYRGAVLNTYPGRRDLASADPIDVICSGWLPPAPFITQDKYITTFGSCFARHITEYLYEQGFRVFGRDLTNDAYVIRAGDGMVNSAAILQQLQWAYGELEFDGSLWDDDPESVERKRVNSRKIFDDTDVFIVTLGLSEVWYDRQSGEIFWRAIPRSKFDPQRHGFRVTSFQENKENLVSIHRLIRQKRPHASLIVTLSPIPLLATFREVSCITANSASKALLRAAIDEFFRETSDANMFYFPSYEIVTDFSVDPFKDDLRHPKTEVLQTVLKTFHRGFLAAA